MRRLGMSIAVIALVSASTVIGAQGFKKISEILTGWEEVPSVSTTGNWKLQRSDQQRRITNRLGIELF